MNETLKVLIVEQDIKPYVTEIENTLEAMQEMVYGYIECIDLENGKAVIVCNEEGKFFANPNRDIYVNDIYPGENKEKFDIICGPFMILESDYETGDFKSISDDNIEKYAKRFEKQEYIDKYSVNSLLGRIQLAQQEVTQQQQQHNPSKDELTL